MKFKDRIIQEFGEYIYRDKNGEYAFEREYNLNRPCFVFLKDGYLSCKCSSIVQEKSFKQCYLLLKQGIYQKIKI